MNYFSLITLLFLPVFVLTGCTQKEIQIKYIKIKPTYPKLKTYEYNKTLNLQVRKQNDKICVKSWKTCIPEKEFKTFYNYIKEIKLNLSKCNNEINVYNKNYIKTQ